MKLSCAHCIASQEDSRKWIDAATYVGGTLLCVTHARIELERNDVRNQSFFDRTLHERHRT